jgi:hypothetical protein
MTADRTLPRRLRVADRLHRATSHDVLLMAAAAAVLVPWIVFLAASLPMRHEAHHWRITWVGFDFALALTFLAAALARRRRSSSFPDLLIAAGVLLMCDAWFDLITASSAHELVMSAVEALCAEAPLSFACFALSRRWRSNHVDGASRALTVLTHHDPGAASSRNLDGEPRPQPARLR